MVAELHGHQTTETLAGLSSGSTRGTALEISLGRHLQHLRDELSRARRRADELRRIGAAAPGEAGVQVLGSERATDANRNNLNHFDLKLARAFLGLC